MEQFTGIKKMNGLYTWLKKSKNLLRAALILLFFASSGSAFSQLSYTQDFEGSHGWTGFSSTTTNACSNISVIFSSNFLNQLI
jgi:hypothetical protein